MYFQFFIYDIVNGKFLDEEKVILSKSGIKASQVAIVGYIVGVEDRGKYKVVYLNDGTGTMEIRIFESQLFDVFDGECVLILGRVRKFREKIYIVPKHIVKISEKQYMILRANIARKYLKKGVKFEIERLLQPVETKRVRAPIKEEFEEAKEEKILVTERSTENIIELRKTIVRLIDDLDKGEGVDVQTLYELSGAASRELFDRVIQELLMTGEIYEPKPGRLKLLKE